MADDSCQEYGDSSTRNAFQQKPGFLDLPWEDIIFSRIFVYLRLSDICKYHRVSRAFYQLCSTFFNYCGQLDASGVANRITKDALHRIAEETNHLKTLILQNCKNSVKDDLILKFLKQNPHLTRINLNSCNSLSNLSVTYIGQYLQQLEQLNLRECRFVSKDSVINIAVSCPNLQVVDLSGCWEVTDHCLVVLMKACPEITHLCVNGCYAISDTSLRVASRHLLNLTRLEIDGCWRVSNHAVKLIGEYCRQLKYLNVQDCRDVTDASLARIRLKGVQVNVEPSRTIHSTRPSLLTNIHGMHMTPVFRCNPTQM